MMNPSDTEPLDFDVLELNVLDTNRQCDTGKSDQHRPRRCVNNEILEVSDEVSDRALGKL